MSKIKSTASVLGGEIGFFGLPTIAFIVLRLVGVISWSWLWVLSPLWLPAAVVLAIVLVVALVAVLYGWIQGRKGY